MALFLFDPDWNRPLATGASIPNNRCDWLTHIMTRYTPVSTRLNLPATEDGMLEHWRRDHTFEKSVAKRAGGPLYAFDDGPPFATGCRLPDPVSIPYWRNLVRGSWSTLLPSS